jgi:hypothetical protein
VLSYSLDGEPRAARRVVALDPLDLGTAVVAPVGGDLAVLGSFQRPHDNVSPQAPYDAFLMRIRGDTPSGATLAVE